MTEAESWQAVPKNAGEDDAKDLHLQSVIWCTKVRTEGAVSNLL